MSKTPTHPKETPPRISPTVVLLLGTIADTTWRLFVPTVLLALIGAHFDIKYAIAPIFTVLGSIIGAAIAGYLVYRQLKKDI